MAGKYISRGAEVKAELRALVARECRQVAQFTAIRASQNIMRNVGAEGLALGSGQKEADLAASVYIADAEYNGYDEAKSKASFGRDAKRGLWAEPVEVSTADGPSTYRVKVGFALGRAILMHDGYYDPRAGGSGHWMFGRAFLGETLGAAWDDLVYRVGASLPQLESLSVTVVSNGGENMFSAQSASELMEAEFYENKAIAQRELRSDGDTLANKWDAFAGAYGSQMKRQRGPQKGFRQVSYAVAGGKRITSKYFGMKKVYQWESAAERLSRISQAFEQFIQSGGSEGHDHNAAFGASDEIRRYVRGRIGSRA